MLTKNYNTGRFPPAVPSLQDIAAEEVARQIGMASGRMTNPELYANAMGDPSSRNSILNARKRAFSDHARLQNMARDRQRFRRTLHRQMEIDPDDMTVQSLLEHREKVADMLSDEAIAHAAGPVPTEDVPAILRMQTPPERLNAQSLPAVLPPEFVNYIDGRLGLSMTSQYSDVLFHHVRRKFRLPYTGYQALLTTLWKEWQGRRVQVFSE